MNWTLFVLFAPFLGALFAPHIIRLLGANGAYVLALIPASLFVYFTGFMPEISAGERITGGVEWVPSLGVNMSWLLDGLSLTFALLITGIGTLIVLYSGGYLAGHPQQGRFIGFILLFMGAMQGLVLADNIITLFVFWELTSISSFLLIGFDHERTAARRAAVQALVVTGLGGLSLLAGLIVIWNITGYQELSLILSSGDIVRDSSFYALALILVLGGAFTKSAQMPLHFWLPNAMEAPTPVSAYLHSATMVKAGVYLLMRMNPVLGETVLWETILPFFGAITLVGGALLAVRQTDLKLMLAYTTVASLGLLVMLVGVGTEKALAAATLYLIAHSLFKGTLFMVAGVIDHEAGTRDINKLGGLRKAMPMTFAAGLLAALSMGGITPLFGFLAKEEIYYALQTGGVWISALLIAAIVGNALMFAIGFFVGLKPFWGEKVETPKHAHDGPLMLMAGPVVLSVLGLIGGIFSYHAHKYFSMPMATAVLGEDVTIKISAIPHLNFALAMSVVTIILGVLIYKFGAKIRDSIAAFLDAVGWGLDKGFDQAMAGIVLFASSFTARVQNGRLDRYMTVTFILVGATLIWPMTHFGELPNWPEIPQMHFYEWVVLIMAIVGIGAVIAAENRLTAIVSLGIQGFAVALLFLLFGAPDLSFTQFMVETLSVVILALVMTQLRLSPRDRRPLGETLFDGAIALVCGAGFALLLLSSLQTPFDASLPEFFNQYATPIAHGRNIVNVILVDFRGVDTLGEIGVVAVAGLAILAMIRVRVFGMRKKSMSSQSEVSS